MRRFAPFLVLVAFTVGCADNLTPQQQVFATKSQYDIALGQVLTYAELPRCTTDLAVACSNGEIVSKANRFAKDTKDGLDEAEAAVRTIEGEGAEAYVAFARAALARLTAYLIAEGVLS
jgi:hypothetical protein